MFRSIRLIFVDLFTKYYLKYSNLGFLVSIFAILPWNIEVVVCLERCFIFVSRVFFKNKGEGSG